MRRLAPWLLLIFLSACAAPAQRIDPSVVMVRADGPRESALGTAVSIAPGIVITVRHVADAAGPWGRLLLMRGDGAVVEARLLARSDTVDLAVLQAPEGFLAPRELATAVPQTGARVQADGTAGGVIRRVAGPVAAAPFRLAGYGSGFIADLAAVPGFSGGPVTDAAGRVLGLTAAQIVGPLPATPLAAGGVIRAGQVFVLGAPAIAVELRRLLP